MHATLQRRLKGLLSNMHGQHPKPAIGLCIIFINIVGLLLGDHACTSATPLSRPTEKALAVAVGHCDGVTQAFTLQKMHQGKGLRAVRVYLLL